MSARRCRCEVIDAYLAAPGAALRMGASFDCPTHGDRTVEAEEIQLQRETELARCAHLYCRHEEGDHDPDTEECRDEYCPCQSYARGSCTDCSSESRATDQAGGER